MKRSAQSVCMSVFFGLVTALLISAPALAIDKSKISTKKKFSLSKLQSKYKKAGSLQSEIIQEVYQAALARTKTSKGALTLSKPGQVKWEIFEPEANVMVSNGRKLWYYTPDAGGKNKGQVIVRKAAELERQPIFRILTGSAALSKEFTIESQTDISSDLAQGEMPWMEIALKPKKAVGDLAMAKLKVNSKYLITEIIIENLSGNKTKITLQNQNLGAKLPPVLFEFKPPPGTEVIKNNE